MLDIKCTKEAAFSSTISIGGIFAASSLGEGIDSLHLDFEAVVGVAVDVVVVVVGIVAWEVPVVTVGLVVALVVVEDCKSILMIPLSRF